MADLSGLDHGMPENPIPAATRGRVIHIDGDILAYYCAGNDETPLGVARRNLHSRIETLAAWAGATRAVVHITHPLSNKGQRFKIAVTKPYQAQRSYGKRPKNWQGLRELLEGLALTDNNYVSYRYKEADDGMAEAAWEAFYAGELELSVTCSADKDLRQCPGLHLDMDTLELWTAEHTHVYSDWLKADEATQAWMTRGTLGKGRLFHGVWFLLWQMLAGDGADNIPGIEVIPGSWLLEHFPEHVSQRALAGKEKPKDKKVGYGLAADLLGVLRPDKPSEGYRVVKDAYEAAFGKDYEARFIEQWELLCLDFDETGRKSRLELARRIRDGEYDAKNSA